MIIVKMNIIGPFTFYKAFFILMFKMLSLWGSLIYFCFYYLCGDIRKYVCVCVCEREFV